MDSFKILAVSFLVALIGTGTEAVAQSTTPIDSIQKQLLQFYQPAKATADGTDLVTAGAVLVLQKDHLLMDRVDQPLPAINTYQNGAISSPAAALRSMKLVNVFLKYVPGAGQVASASDSANSAAGTDATREFVAGEKFFVTKIDTRADSVVLYFISDPIKDVRYHASLKFPFPKGASPSPDDVAALVSEVIKVDDTSQDQNASSNSQQGAAAAPDTKTIAVGQTRDQVVAMFGAPSKIVQLGTKEIDVFPDMKVTFVQNKVVDVQ